MGVAKMAKIFNVSTTLWKVFNVDYNVLWVV